MWYLIVSIPDLCTLTYFAIEGGRYLNIPKHERICTACNSGEVEDEEHFLLNCSLYKPLRQVLCSKLVKFTHRCPPILSKNVLIKEKLHSLKSYVLGELSNLI